jgi:RNA polymerase sigma-70 factor (ECF subfamily)
VANTDWAGIIRLYDDLLAIKPSPVAALNRAIAVGMSAGHEAGVAELMKLRAEPALRDYHLLPASLGALWLRAGKPERAAEHYREALAMRCSAPARRFLERQLARCQPQ